MIAEAVAPPILKTAPILNQKQPAREKLAVIDCDIHNAMPNDKTLLKYLPARWRRHYETIGMRSYIGSSYPRAMKNAARHDSWPASGLPPGAISTLCARSCWMNGRLRWASSTVSLAWVAS